MRRRKCGCPAIWLVHRPKRLKQRGLALLSIPVYSSQKAGPTPDSPRSNAESPSRTCQDRPETKSSCTLGGREKERKSLSGLVGRGFSNAGLNPPPADRPQTLNPKPLCPYEHRRRELVFLITCSADPGNQDGHG